MRRAHSPRSDSAPRSHSLARYLCLSLSRRARRLRCFNPKDEDYDRDAPAIFARIGLGVTRWVCRTILEAHSSGRLLLSGATTPGDLRELPGTTAEAVADDFDSSDVDLDEIFAEAGAGGATFSSDASLTEAATLSIAPTEAATPSPRPAAH